MLDFMRARRTLAAMSAAKQKQKTAPQKPGAAPKTGAGAAGPFAAHKVMRERLRAAIKQGSFALLDIGSSKIACLIAEIGAGGDEPALKIVGAGLNRSRGVKLGSITDMDEAERAIRAAVNQAERDAGRRVFHAVATITGAYPRSQAFSAEVAIDKGRIAPADLAKAVGACRPPPEKGGYGEGRHVLHATPVNWSVDAEQGVRDPVGFSGRRLGVDLHVLTIAENALDNLAHCIAKADLEIAGAVSTPYASGMSCLLEEELEDGAACIDMGGGATSLSMFLKRKMIFADVVRMGGDHVTLDIVRGLGLGQADAERLKTLEGSAIAIEGAARDPLDLGGWSFDAGGRPTRSDLSAVIRPRVEETLELARDRLEQAGFAYLPTRRIVLTGGAAQLPGVIETAQRLFGRQARLGRPLRLDGLPATYAGPAFSACAGLAAYAIATEKEAWDFAAKKAATPSGTIAGVWRWLRETW